ncbi:MAG: hypothetical protein WB424_18465 [Terracidiphilus sp.]
MKFSGMWKATAAGMMALAMVVAPAMSKAQGGATVLKPAEVEKLLPASVFYRGQSATTQLRNSGGVKFADGFYVLTTLVDTSGYSTGIQSKYSAYFITEVPIKVGGVSLRAGVYGVGIVGSKFVVTDVGAHDLLSVPLSDDAQLAHPMPLEVMADPAGGFRLYIARKYVVFNR